MSMRGLSHSTEKGLPEATGMQNPSVTQGTGGFGDATKPHSLHKPFQSQGRQLTGSYSAHTLGSFTKVPGKRADGGDTATAPPSHHGRVARGGPGGQAGARSDTG